MELLTFAHFKEAEAFLKHLKSEKTASGFNGLFKTDQAFLLITGEGLFSALNKTSAALTWLKTQNSSITLVTNLGVAGALSEKIKSNEIYLIDTIYAESKPFKMGFKSFTANETKQIIYKKTDCVSSFNRVLNKKHAHTLNCFACLVDRELWAIAYACSLYNISFRSFKLASDKPIADFNNSKICQMVIENAHIYSKKLFECYKTISNSKLNIDYGRVISEKKKEKIQKQVKIQKQAKIQKNLPHKLNTYFNSGVFHITESQKQKIEKLLGLIAIRENISAQKVLQYVQKTSWFKELSQNQKPTLLKNQTSKDNHMSQDSFFSSYENSHPFSFSYKELNEKAKKPSSFSKKLISSQGPKERTKELIKQLEKQLNPFKNKVQNQLQEAFQNFDKGQILLEPNFENTSLDIKVKIKSKRQFEQLKINLNSLNYEKIEDILNGQF